MSPVPPHRRHAGARRNHTPRSRAQARAWGEAAGRRPHVPPGHGARIPGGDRARRRRVSGPPSVHDGRGLDPARHRVAARRAKIQPSDRHRKRTTSGLIQAPSGSDVLRWPVIGGFLRWRHARTTLQLLAAPRCRVSWSSTACSVPRSRPPISPRSSRGSHYRGLLVIVLLAAGNFFCMGCPFVLVARRRAAGSARPGCAGRAACAPSGSASPSSSPCSSATSCSICGRCPRATAFLALAYFGAALAIDLVFSGATFCKYLCPIGQFNFVASTVSPLEVRVREPETCRTCRTVDCIKGRRQPGAPHLVTAAGMRAAALPALEGRQHGLHLLPGLRAGVSARQRRARDARAGRRTGRRPAALGHRPVRTAAGHCGAGRGVRVRRAC